MGAIAEWPVLGLFAVAQVVISGCLDLKLHRARFDLHVDVVVCAYNKDLSDMIAIYGRQDLTVTERLTLRLPTQAPRIFFFRVEMNL